MYAEGLVKKLNDSTSALHQTCYYSDGLRPKLSVCFCSFSLEDAVASLDDLIIDSVILDILKHERARFENTKI